MLNFLHHYSNFQCPSEIIHHADLLLKKHVLLINVKNICPKYFHGNHDIHFVSGFFDDYKVQKNSNRNRKLFEIEFFCNIIIVFTVECVLAEQILLKW